MATLTWTIFMGAFALIEDVTRRMLVNYQRRFGTLYWSHIQGPSGLCLTSIAPQESEGLIYIPAQKDLYVFFQSFNVNSRPVLNIYKEPT
jgi:hypothetical protein